MLGLSPKLFGVAVHSLHQRGDALRRGELVDAVAQVENMCVACAVTHVWFAKTVQHMAPQLSHLFWRGKQGVGI